jgi:hypothetical protein
MQRWATAEYEAPMRDAVHIGTTERIERVAREVSALIGKAERPPSAPRISLPPLRRSRSGGYGGGWGEAVRPKVVAGRPSFGGRRTTELRNQSMLVTLNRLPTSLLPRGLSV